MSKRDDKIVIDSFEQVRRDSNSTLFRRSRPLTTLVGPIDVQIEIELPTRELESQHVLESASLVSHFRKYEVQALELLYAHYQSVDRGWLARLEIRPDLNITSALGLVEDLRLAIRLPTSDEEEPYRRLYALPAWDREHAFYLSPDPVSAWMVEDY